MSASDESGLAATVVRAGASSPDAVACLDEDRVLSFLDHRLAAPDRAAVEAHLDDCKACRQLVALMAKEDSATQKRDARLSPLDPNGDARLSPEQEQEGQSSVPLRGLQAERAASEASEVGSTGFAGPGPLVLGEAVGHFRVERLLGRGGMGDVYLARDSQLDRPVALKLIGNNLLDSEEAKERFLIEARATARFNHPNIVAIHSVGSEQGRTYLALEYVDGESLKARLDRGPLGLPEALRVAREIASALSEAHQHQVLHRDLKPHNVMIDKSGRCRVLDFGLAKLFPRAGEPSDTGQLFETLNDPAQDTLRGTPGYMAPEQWKKEAVGPPADVWALGVILYELLSGSRPYSETSPISYAVKVCAESPAPALPTGASAPESVADLIARCLEKNPARRPTAATVLGELEALLSDDALRIANELSLAADRWSRSGKPEGTLWDKARLDQAQRAIEERAFPLAATAARFLTASLQLEGRRAESRRKRWVGVALLSAATAGLAFTLFHEATLSRDRAELEKKRARTAEARALLEGAESALLKDAPVEAQAKLRTALELEDSAAARILGWRLAHAPLMAARALGTGFYGLALSPDGKTVATAAQDKTVYLLDADLLETRSLRGHSDQVVEIAYAPDGAAIASASWSGELRVWRPADRSARVLIAKGPRLTGLAFTPQGALLAARLDGAILRFEAGASEPTEWSAPGRSVADLALDPSGALLAAAEKDGAIHVYDAVSGAAVATLGPKDSAPLLSVAASPSGAAWAAGAEDGRGFVVSKDGAVLARLDGHSGPIQRVAFASAEAVITASADHTLRRFDLNNGTSAILGTHDGGVWGLAVHKDGTVLSAGMDGAIRRWRMSGLEPPPVGHADSVAALAFSPDGHTLASGSYDRSLHLWDVARGEERTRIRGFDGTVYGLSFSPDGKKIASASLDHRVRVHDAATGKLLREIGDHPAGVYAVLYTPDGRGLISAGSDGVLRVHDADNGRALASLSAHQGPVFALALSPDGKTVASGGADKRILLHPLGGKGRAQVLSGSEGAIRGLAFAPDGRTLAAVGYDGVLRLFDLRGGGAPRVLGRQEGRLYSVSYSPDGSSLLSSGADGMLRVWPVSGAAPLVIRAHPGEANTARFAPDGSIASGGDDATVRLFDAQGRPRWAPAVLDARPGAHPACAVGVDTIEAWDPSSDTRRFNAPFEGVSEARPFSDGCVARSGNTLRRFGADGAFVELRNDARAFSVAGARLLIATGDRLLLLEGSDQKELPIDPGVTALAEGDGQIWAGYANGAIEPVDRPDLPLLHPGIASPVSQLAIGARGTLIAGFMNGQVRVLDRASANVLGAAQLHGPITALFASPARIDAGSALGGVWHGPDGLDQNYCTLVRALASAGDVAWENGAIVHRGLSKEHPCASH